ncbi:MAG: thrombospondin type 3 repeat-containing protein, partial [Candidatus Heimdallarchaeaceae archaeon]
LGEYQNSYNPHNSDTDGDHMPDGYEVNYGLNPLVDDAEDDADSDGIDNYTEYIDGTSPTSADTDNDGWTDKEEKDAGTDPLDPNNHPEEGPTDTSFLYIFGIVGLLSMVTLLRKKFNR